LRLTNISSEVRISPLSKLIFSNISTTNPVSQGSEQPTRIHNLSREFMHCIIFITWHLPKKQGIQKKYSKNISVLSPASNISVLRTALLKRY